MLPVNALKRSVPQHGKTRLQQRVNVPLRCVKKTRRQWTCFNSLLNNGLDSLTTTIHFIVSIYPCYHHTRFLPICSCATQCQDCAPTEQTMRSNRTMSFSPETWMVLVAHAWLPYNSMLCPQGLVLVLCWRQCFPFSSSMHPNVLHQFLRQMTGVQDILGKSRCGSRGLSL